MSRLTIYLARLLGLFLLILALAMLVKQQALAATVAGLVAAAQLLFVIAMMALASGLAIVLAHNRWSGGAATVLVTLFGWILTLRGVLLLFLPAQTIANLFTALNMGRFAALYALVPLALGAYLTYAGFTARLDQ